MTDADIWRLYLTPWNKKPDPTEKPKGLRELAVDELRRRGFTTEQVRKELDGQVARAEALRVKPKGRTK